MTPTPTRNTFAIENALPWYGQVPKTLRGNLAWRTKLIKECKGSKAKQREIVKACREDFLFWINTFGFTYDPRILERGNAVYGKVGSNLPFITFPFQDKAALTVIRCIEEGNDCVILKSRDMGASWMLLMVCLWHWLFFDLKSFLLISRKKEYVDSKKPGSMMWKLDHAYKHLPPWMKPLQFDRIDMHFGNGDNGSVIDGETTTKDAGRADRLTAIIPDEFATMPDGGVGVEAGTTSATNCRIFNSTPKGQGNVFYEKAMNDKNIVRIKMMWWQHPVKRIGLYRYADGRFHFFDDHKFPDGYKLVKDGRLRSPWYDKERQRFSHEQLAAQELDCDFFASDFQFFPPDVLEEVAKNSCRRPIAVGRLSYDKDEAVPKGFVPTSEDVGKFRAWVNIGENLKPDATLTYVVGCDISNGTGATNSVASVGCVETGEKVAEYADAHMGPRAFARFCVALCRYFKGKDQEGAFLIFEANGPGAAFAKTIMELHYGRVYIRKTHELGLRAKGADKAGWWNTGDNQMVLLTEFAEALKAKEVIIRSKESVSDCRLWVYGSGGKIYNKHAKTNDEMNPSGASVNHSDRVVADALMWKGMKEIGVKVQVEKSYEPPVGSLAWRDLQAKLKARAMNDSVAAFTKDWMAA